MNGDKNLKLKDVKRKSERVKNEKDDTTLF
jgi:hypothetical protein